MGARSKNHRREEGEHARGAREPRVTPFQVESEELVVLSFPLDAPVTDIALTPSELEIAAAVREGKSNADIARIRGTSVRTVANQLAGLFRKLGVRSRSELIRALHRPTDGA